MALQLREGVLLIACAAAAAAAAWGSLRLEGERFRAEAVLWARQEKGEEVQIREKGDLRRLETKAHMAALKEMAGSGWVLREAARWAKEEEGALRQSVQVSAVQDSELLRVAAEAGEPGRARRRAEAAARAVVEVHARIREERARQGLGFIDSQYLLAEAEWREASRRAASFRKKHHLLSEEGQASYLLGRLSALETQLADARAEEDRVKEQCRVSESLLRQEPEFRVSSRMTADNPALPAIKGELASFEARLAADRVSRTESHHEIRSLRARVESLQMRLREEEVRLSRTETSGRNSLWEELAVRCALLKADREGAGARRRRLEEELEPVKEEMEALPEAIRTLHHLEARSLSVEETCKLLRSKREEAVLRVQEAALRPEIQVLSWPDRPGPVDRRPGLRITLAALLGLTAGWGVLCLRLRG